MKYIIIEDEPLATEKIRDFAGRIPGMQELASFIEASAAIQYLQTQPAELIFLDLNIGDLSGIQFLEISQPECPVIVLTAYQEHAIRGFELDVTDYLLKPFTFMRFEEAVERARQRTGRKQDKEFLFIRDGKRLEKLVLSELLFIEGAGDYRRIHTAGKSFLTLETFRQLEHELPASRFIRVHKSFLVSLDKIDSLENDLIRIGSRLIPVSESYKKELVKKMH